MQEKLKILVTGATGHVGNNLVKKLNSIGITPYCLVLENDNCFSIRNDSYNKIIGNIIDREQMFSIIKEMDIVIHLASQISIKANDDYLKLHSVNVSGTINIADACLNYDKKLIYASSVHTIPITINNKPMSEPTSFNIDTSHGNYEKTKSIATDYVYNLSHNKGLKATIIYPSGIIGENDYFISELSTLFIDIANKKLPGYVKGGYAFVDVKDVVDMIVEIINRNKYNTEYIISGEYLSIKDVIETINKCYQRDKLPILFSTWFVKCMIPFLSLQAKIKNKKPLFTFYSLKTILSNSNFNISKAKKELNYEPRDVKLSIVNALNWLLKNKDFKFNKKSKSTFKNITATM